MVVPQNMYFKYLEFYLSIYLSRYIDREMDIYIHRERKKEIEKEKEKGKERERERERERENPIILSAQEHFEAKTCARKISIISRIGAKSPTRLTLSVHPSIARFLMPVCWSVGPSSVGRSFKFQRKASGKLHFKQRERRTRPILKICNIPQNRLLLIVIYFSTLFRFIQGFPKKTPVSQKSKIFLIYSVMIGM